MAALLLAWIDEPELFLEVEPLDVALGRRESFGRFLLSLAGDAVDDEAFLEICRAAGL